MSNGKVAGQQPWRGGSPGRLVGESNLQAKYGRRGQSPSRKEGMGTGCLHSFIILANP